MKNRKHKRISCTIKRTICSILAIFLCISMIPASYASRDYSEATSKAEALKTLGLFKGVSDNDFALNRAPTRVEALVIFLRMLGEEDDALSTNSSHPFSDVPLWANKQVAYAYSCGYTTGTSSTTFGSSSPASSAMFLTFTLRALGYNDSPGGDFVWNNPFSLAAKIGALPNTVDTERFERADTVLIAWETMFVPMKGGNKDLCDILIMGGVFTRQQLDKAIAMVESGGSVNSTKLGRYVCHTDSNGFTYDSRYRPVLNLMESNKFTMTMNYGEGMQDFEGTWRRWSEQGSSESYIFLTVSKPSMNEGDNFTFYVRSDGDLVSSDGFIGITPTDSLFTYEGGDTTPKPPPQEKPGGELEGKSNLAALFNVFETYPEGMFFREDGAALTMFYSEKDKTELAYILNLGTDALSGKILGQPDDTIGDKDSGLRFEVLSDYAIRVSDGGYGTLTAQASGYIGYYSRGKALPQESKVSELIKSNGYHHLKDGQRIVVDYGVNDADAFIAYQGAKDGPFIYEMSKWGTLIGRRSAFAFSGSILLRGDDSKGAAAVPFDSVCDYELPPFGGRTYLIPGFADKRIGNTHLLPYEDKNTCTFNGSPETGVIRIYSLEHRVLDKNIIAETWVTIHFAQAENGEISYSGSIRQEDSAGRYAFSIVESN